MSGQIRKLSPEDKVKAGMDVIDALPKEVRELVHEFGYTMIRAFLDLNVTKASAIRHLILQVKRGSLDTGNGKSAQSGRIMVAIPSEPTPEMIYASMNTVTPSDPVIVTDKYEKHKLRLRAALKAGAAWHL
jgi:hypothetical protein